jgi:hypothetical protein
LVAAGAAGLFYGTKRYRQVSVEIESQRFVSGVGVRGPTIAAGVLTTAILASLLLLTLD